MMNHNRDDWNLLRDYIDNGSQMAFAALVKRYVMLVGQIKTGVVACLGLTVAGSGAGKVATMAVASAQEHRRHHPVMMTALKCPQPVHKPLGQQRVIGSIRRIKSGAGQVRVKPAHAGAEMIVPGAWLTSSIAQAASGSDAEVRRTLYPRLAQTEPPVAEAADAEFTLQPGEILLRGKIVSVDPAKRQLVLETTSYTLPNGKTSELPQPKPKTVLLDVKALLHVRGEVTNPVVLTDLKPGISAIAMGHDKGSGQALPGRRLAVWDTVQDGKFTLSYHQPGAQAALPDTAPATEAQSLPQAGTPGSLLPATGNADFSEVAPVDFPDGKFEEVDAKGNPFNWSLTFPKNTRVVEEDGNHFLRLTNQDLKQTIISEYRFVIHPQWKYITLRARLRTTNLKRRENAQSWDGAGLGYHFERKAGERVGDYPPTSLLYADSDWVVREVHTTVPPGAKAVRLLPILQQTTGTLDMDDIEIIGEFTPSARPIRPGFPEGRFEMLDAKGSPIGWKLGGLENIELAEEDGNQFLRLTNADPRNGAFIHSRYKLEPGTKTLKVRVRLRGRGLVAGKESWHNARLGIAFEDANGQRVGGWPQTPALNKDSGWVSQEVVLAVPEGSVYILLTPIIQECIGTFDVDDILLESLDEEDKIPQNSRKE